MLPMQDRWRVFIGYLAESTGYRNQRTFHVYVPETLPTYTGDITPEVATHSVKVTNVMTNQTDEANVGVVTTIKAEYLGLLTSRTVPTMYKNQQVLVLNFSNDDRFFWIPLDRDDYLRTFEQIRFSALDQAVTNKSSATGSDIEKKQSSITNDNSYYFEIDTKYGKHIMMSTASTDGESWRYFFKIDANSHSVEIWDQSIKDPSIPSNSIKLESQPMPGCKGRIKLETAGGASLTLEDKNSMLNIPGNLEVSVGGTVVTNIQGNTTASFGGNVGSTITGKYLHYGMDDTVLNFVKHLGIAVTQTYTLSVKGPMVTSTLTSALHMQPMRTVITEGMDTVTAITAIQNYTNHTVTTIGVETLNTSSYRIQAASADWSVASMEDTYILEIPTLGRVPCQISQIT